MAKPHLTLKKWLSTDTELKKEFFEVESKKPLPAVQKFIHNNKKYFFCTKQFFTQPYHMPHQNPEDPTSMRALQYSQIVDTGSFIVEVDLAYFEILKKKFRSFKHQQLNLKNNRIIKQIAIKQHTLDKLNKLIEKNNLKSLQNGLEYLIDVQNFSLESNNKKLRQAEDELGAMKKKNTELKQQLASQKQQEKYEIEKNNNAAKEFEDYLTKTALRAKQQFEKFKAHLGELSEVDLSDIDNALSDKELKKIEDQFIKDCKHKKQLLYLQHQSFTNDALNFDQHK